MVLKGRRVREVLVLKAQRAVPVFKVRRVI